MNVFITKTSQFLIATAACKLKLHTTTEVIQH